jgi:chemotaxis protein histidine kinase CheA
MVDDQIYASARDYIELLFGNRVKETLVSDLNPLDRIEVFGADNTRHYLNFNFNRVFEGTEVSHLLVTVQDVTDVVHLSEELEASKDQARREIEVLLDLLGRDPASLGQFLSNTESALAQINERMRNNDDTMQGRSHTVSFIMRVVHGIKGESAALNIEMFEGYAHDFEQELSEMRDRGEIRGEDVVRISVLLEGFYDRLSTVSTVMKRFNGSDVPAQVVEEMPAEVFENHIKSLAARIAEDSGKNVSVNVDADALNMLPNRIFNELQGITIQLVRNALKHGVETPPLRQAAGKPETGRVAVSCRDLGNNLCELSVRDDGAGISVERIRQRLIDTGVMTATDARNLSAQEVIMHIFKTGFSTATEADRDAGRGVGLDIVSEKVVQLHGNLTLNSKVGEFTEFKITFVV